MTKLKAIRSGNKNLRVFVFTTLNALILFLIQQLGNITDPNVLAIAPFLIALMNMGTKYINNKLLNDVGVEKNVLP